MAGGDCCSCQYFEMFFKTLNLSERTDHKNDWTFCSDSIFVLSSYTYGEIADRAQVLMHLSLFPGQGEGGRPREIDLAKSPLGQRFDKQLYPASGEIDKPREN